jgi:hypothetical protein
MISKEYATSKNWDTEMEVNGSSTDMALNTDQKNGIFLVP